MSGTFRICFQKGDGLNSSDDDVITICRSKDNDRLYDVRVRYGNSRTTSYSGLFSHNDMFAYLENLFNVSLYDLQGNEYSITGVQYDIPGFPSVVVPAIELWDESTYDAFMGAVEFWMTSM
jgi:hypothetical protein